MKKLFKRILLWLLEDEVRQIAREEIDLSRAEMNRISEEIVKELIQAARDTKITVSSDKP